MTACLDVQIHLLDPLCEPKKLTEGAAGYDVVARVDCEIPPGERRIIPVGFRIELPPGTEAQIRGRSGLNLKGYVVPLGTVDADYRGEVAVIMKNETTLLYKVERGQRLAQMVIQVLPQVTLRFVEELSDSARAEGGFGSTGK